MINFHYEINFELFDEAVYRNWISNVIKSEHREEGEINYIFCDDQFLYRMNINYLNHKTLTDIISFDYSEGNLIHGDIFISIDRVKDNARIYSNSFRNELSRVMIHGILHCCGYKDKKKGERFEMRRKEDEKMKMFSF
jgi:probable rRNA maturation factor